MARVDNKVAIVTGVVSPTLIARTTAYTLAGEGAKVVLADEDIAQGTRIAREMGGDVMFLEHDVREEKSWQRIMSETTARFGRLDILVNAASITGAEARENVETITLNAWRDVQAVNVEGLMLGCKWAVRVMKEQRSGSIINISSMAALIGTATLPAYGASKAAVRQITQTVAQHCARNGYHIRCNSVHPGIIDTELSSDTFTQEQLANLRRAVPTGEFGKPKDIAEAVLYLASDESRYLTGTRLVVDGGATMQ